MTDDEVLKHAEAVRHAILSSGSSAERDWTPGADPDKPTYRALSYILAPNFHHENREPVRAGDDPALDIETTAKIFVNIDPYFAAAYRDHFALFESDYNFIKEAWE